MDTSFPKQLQFHQSLQILQVEEKSIHNFQLNDLCEFDDIEVLVLNQYLLNVSLWCMNTFLKKVRKNWTFFVMFWKIDIEKKEQKERLKIIKERKGKKNGKKKAKVGKYLSFPQEKKSKKLGYQFLILGTVLISLMKGELRAMFFHIFEEALLNTRVVLKTNKSRKNKAQAGYHSFDTKPSWRACCFVLAAVVKTLEMTSLGKVVKIVSARGSIFLLLLEAAPIGTNSLKKKFGRSLPRSGIRFSLMTCIEIPTRPAKSNS